MNAVPSIASRGAPPTPEPPRVDGFRVIVAPAGRKGVPAAKLKAERGWQEALWQRWPREESWPAKMDVYEAAAYLRVSLTGRTFLDHPI